MIFVFFAEDKNSLAPFKTNLLKDIREAYDKSFESVSVSSTTTVSPNADNKVFNSRQSVRQKALTTKNAKYRGLKQVLTALDLNDDDEL